MINFKEEKNITIFEHPLIQHKISILRDKETGTNEFRKLVEEIAMPLPVVRKSRNLSKVPPITDRNIWTVQTHWNE